MSFTASDVLLKAASRIEEEGKWCQGSWFNDESNCALGYLFEVAQELAVPDAFGEAHILLIQMLGPVVDFNDAPGRTAHEVAEAMRQAALQ